MKKAVVATVFIVFFVTFSSFAFALAAKPRLQTGARAEGRAAWSADRSG